jgi:hypothetical protein
LYRSGHPAGGPAAGEVDQIGALLRSSFLELEEDFGKAVP